MAVTIIITWSSQKFQLILGYIEIFNFSRGVPVCGKQKKAHSGEENKLRHLRKEFNIFLPMTCYATMENCKMTYKSLGSFSKKPLKPQGF